MLKLIDIRPGEGQRAVLAFAMLLLVVGAITVVKTVRDALFLSKFGVTQLSFIAIGLAVVTSFIVSLYLRLTAGVGRNRLIGGTNVVIAASLAAIWLGLGMARLANVLPWVLYIWSSIFGVFIVMQFWLLANDLFDAREAKRLFGFVGAGAILGGVAGGFASQGLATLLGTRSLLLVAGAMLLLEAGLASVVWRLRRQHEGPAPKASAKQRPGEKKKATGGFATLLEHRYVGLIAMALLMMTMATTLLDWQFKGIVKAAFADRTDEMAGYFGSLYAYLSIVSFGLQAFVTGWVLRRFGVSLGLLLLPAGLLLGSGGILLSAVIPSLSRLAAASGAKIVEGGLRFAIDKASIELMWMPVAPEVKEQGKAFADTVMDRLGTGLTGLVWLLVAALGLNAANRLHLVSFFVIGVGLLWLVIVLRARKAYVGAFREMLAQRQLDLDSMRVNLRDAEAMRTITQGLESSDPRELEFSLYLLASWSGKLPDLSALLEHPNESVVLSTLSLLAEHRDEDHRRAAIACLRSPSEHVRRQAIVYLRASAPQRDTDPLLEELAAEAAKDPDLPQTTIEILALGLPGHADEAATKLERCLADTPVDELPAVLDQLGAAVAPHAHRLLQPYLQHDELSVRHAAMDAAGTTADPEVVAPLIELLDEGGCRPGAALALQELGPVASPELEALLADPGERSYEALAAVVRTLGAGDAVEVAPRLLSLADHPTLRMPALRALVRLRRRKALTLETTRILELVRVEAEELTRELLFLSRGSWATARQEAPSEALLERCIAEGLDGRVERIFRLLALIYDDDDIRSAFRGLRSSLKSIRAGGLEFLDNLLATELKQRLLPLLEDTPAGPFADLAKRSFGVIAESRDALLIRLLSGDDPWQRAMAVHCVGVERREAARSHLAQVDCMGNDVLAAIVARCQAQLDTPTFEEPAVGLTVIEKALKLQTVDVLRRASTEDLAYVAQIAVEEEYAEDVPLYGEGDAPDALYVVLEGKVKLHRGELEIAILEGGEAFGSWALVDDAPRVASATCVETSTVLKVDREEFSELLADRVDIVQAVFKAMVERLRILADVAKAV